jgi:hypothetical protein
MKTKTFFVLCLFIGMATFRLSAQPDLTKSFAMKETWMLWTPVFCDGQVIDYVSGIVEANSVYHFAGGILLWATISSHGEVTGQSGEVFKVMEKDRNIFPLGIDPYHINLKGDQGNHYILSLIYDFANDPAGEHMTVLKAVCVHNGK